MACGAVNPCLQASENGGAAARRGEAAFASGCSYVAPELPNLRTEIANATPATGL
jgi:hypothetical protein